jgi:uncharacterized protein (DUF169 family)
MLNLHEISGTLKEKLALKYNPVGMYYSDINPADSVSFNQKGKGCIMPLLFSAAKGKVVSVDKNTTGWPCSAYYLGYSDWIYEGIEYYLSDGLTNRECEKFTASPELAKKAVESVKININREQYTIFKPLEQFSAGECPEVVTFFVNADQLSALTFLACFDAPERDDIITTRFLSACGSMVALPVQYRQKNKKKAVIGLNDISARRRLPEEVMSFAVTYDLFAEMAGNINKSFLTTTQWEQIKDRLKGRCNNEKCS